MVVISGRVHGELARTLWTEDKQEGPSSPYSSLLSVAQSPDTQDGELGSRAGGRDGNVCHLSNSATRTEVTLEVLLIR